MPRSKSETNTAIGLFAGIGGIELGLSQAGFDTELICEIDAGASQVLKSRFGIAVEPDIRKLRAFPKVDLIAAGFPCQDLSQAGRTAGIAGKQSRLIGEVFKRLRSRANGPRWLLLENVPFMLQLQRGRAMRYLVDELESLGFTWAYRVVDTRAFGVPQRRKRVLLLASRLEDPRLPLFGNDAVERTPSFSGNELCGFYWTEGLRGLGWAVDAIPTLKGGSAIGIPSPPAIWLPNGDIATPDIRDAERLQGFPVGWTKAAETVAKRGARWKLVGNAVSVPAAEWIGRRLRKPGSLADMEEKPLRGHRIWPTAAWNIGEGRKAVLASEWPKLRSRRPLAEFLRFRTSPLSARATKGFLDRTDK